MAREIHVHLAHPPLSGSVEIRNLVEDIILDHLCGGELDIGSEELADLITEAWLKDRSRAIAHWRP